MFQNEQRTTYLKGILLTISTHAGPQLVYHFVHGNVDTISAGSYQTADAQSECVLRHLYCESDSESSIDWSTSDEGDPSVVESKLNISTKKAGESYPLNQNYSNATEDSNILGFESSLLTELLTPPRQMCSQRFQLTVDDLVFVGVPVHVLSSGLWKELKPKLVAKLNSANDKKGALDDLGVHMDVDCPMSMFHVVFALKPPVAEINAVTDQLYYYVLAQFVRELKHVQATKNYVWNEVQNIFKLREEWTIESPEPLNKVLEAKSELIRALKNLFESTLKLEVARVQIGAKVQLFQIPIDQAQDTLPLPYSPCNLFDQSRDLDFKGERAGILLNSPDSYGLLLQDDPENIIKVIQADSAGVVAALIRNILPTATIAALAKANSVPLMQMVKLACSLVYWRRAKVIIPLNLHYIYTVSPLAPMESIDRYSQEFNRIFPTMPKLVTLLSVISSGKPQPFIAHIPSRDHRDMYMNALAWLLQHDLMVHLRTFALIVVTSRVKLASMDDDDQKASRSQLKAVPLPADNSMDNSIKAEQSFQHQKCFKDQSAGLGDTQDSILAYSELITPIEEKWIDIIASYGTSPDMVELFRGLAQYFNGKHALEQVALHESITRHELRKFLHEYRDHIVTYRHW